MKRTSSLCAVGLAAITLIFATALVGNAQERIKFRKGRSSASVTGFLGSEESRDYIIGAREGQVMTLVLLSKGATATVYNKYGSKARLDEDSQTMRYTFGYTGDVSITIYKPGGGATSYTLTVTIR